MVAAAGLARCRAAGDGVSPRLRWLVWRWLCFPEIEPPNPWAVVAHPWVAPHYLRQKSAAPFIEPPPTSRSTPELRTVILDRQINLQLFELFSMGFTAPEIIGRVTRAIHAMRLDEREVLKAVAPHAI